MYISIYIYISIHIYMSTYITFIYVCILCRVHMQIHMYMYTYTYIHVYIYLRLGSMADSGCTVHETEKGLGACLLADEERCHCRGSGSLDVECERNEASSESLGENGFEDEEWFACWCLGSMARSGCAFHETEKNLGACCFASQEQLPCERI